VGFEALRRGITGYTKLEIMVTLCIAPSTYYQKEEIEKLVEILDISIAEAEKRKR